MVYTLPMPTLYHIKLPLAQRVGLMIVFGLGGIVCVAGILRTFWTHHVVYETYDVTWEGFQLWIWTAVEANLGIICGCIPTLRRIFTSGKSRTSTPYRFRKGGPPYQNRRSRHQQCAGRQVRAAVCRQCGSYTVLKPPYYRTAFSDLV